MRSVSVYAGMVHFNLLLLFLPVKLRMQLQTIVKQLNCYSLHVFLYKFFSSPNPSGTLTPPPPPPPKKKKKKKSKPFSTFSLNTHTYKKKTDGPPTRKLKRSQRAQVEQPHLTKRYALTLH